MNIILSIIGVLFVFIFFTATYFYLRYKSDKGFISNIKGWGKKSLPLFIVIDDDFKKYPHVEFAIKYSINLWNFSVGLRLFELYSDSDLDVTSVKRNIVTVSYTKDIKALAYAILVHTKGKIKSAAVLVDVDDIVDMDIKMISGLMLHEFGHLLGLEHDTDINSIMYKSARSEPGKITEKDIKLLQKIYGDKDGLG